MAPRTVTWLIGPTGLPESARHHSTASRIRCYPTGAFSQGECGKGGRQPMWGCTVPKAALEAHKVERLLQTVV